MTCYTFSQKVINVAQYRPLLYPGVIFTFIVFCYVIFRFVSRRDRSIYGVLLIPLYLLLLLPPAFDVVLNPKAQNAFLLNIIMLHIFPITLICLYSNKPIHGMYDVFAKTLCIFAFFQALFAWLFITGFSFFVMGVEYKHISAWDLRLHGVIGEPTHFGLLQGIGLLSLFYLYRIRLLYRSFRLREKLFYIFLSLFYLVSMLASGTRNAMLSTLVSLFFAAIIDKEARRLIVKFSMRIIIPFVMLIVIGFYDEVLLLKSAFASVVRFGDSNSENIRLSAMSHNLYLISEFNLPELLFGIGYSKSLELPTSFNQYLDLVRNYGFVPFLGGAILLFCSWYLYLKKFRQGFSAELLPLMLQAYSLSVFMVYAPFGSVFHIVSFVFMWSVFISFRFDRRLVFTSAPTFALK